MLRIRKNATYSYIWDHYSLKVDSHYCSILSLPRTPQSLLQRNHMWKFLVLGDILWICHSLFINQGGQKYVESLENTENISRTVVSMNTHTFWVIHRFNHSFVIVRFLFLLGRDVNVFFFFEKRLFRYKKATKNQKRNDRF